jgi:hypothetical protein
MWVDPIVQEVRDAGGELAKKANYDLHTFFKNLRDNEKKRASKVISRYIPVEKKRNRPEL